MSLGNDQRIFSLMVAKLIIFAYEAGYEITLGDAFADSGHKEGSFHYLRLAIDLNLFKDGVYLTETSDHEQLGAYWISMGGTWGGNFRRPDGNHYSYTE